VGDAVTAERRRIESLAAGREPLVHRSPRAGWSAG